MRPVTLSERLRAVASMVTRGSRVCDVGCDHGFVPVYLIEQEISPHVLAMDVREGPLGAARQHVAERGLDSCIETRLSDGLHNYEPGEADSLICAGMGGGLIMRILGEERKKTDSFRELILQPQSEPAQLRMWLWEQGYRITDEKMVEEDGKYYPMMRAAAGGRRCGPSDLEIPESDFSGRGSMDKDMLCKLFYRYGAYLLLRGDSVLQSYLMREERIYGKILSSLREQGLDSDKRRKRYTEVEALLEECRVALAIMAYNSGTG